MIKVFFEDQSVPGRLVPGELVFDGQPQKPLWIDLTSPAPEEKEAVEHVTGLVLPDMNLAKRSGHAMGWLAEDGVWMHFPVAAGSEECPRLVQVLFVLTEHCLVTQHSEPWEGEMPGEDISGSTPLAPVLLLQGLLSCSLGRVGRAMDFFAERFFHISSQLFELSKNYDPRRIPNKRLLVFNNFIGQYASHILTLQDHLENIEQCVGFLEKEKPNLVLPGQKPIFAQLLRDVQSVSRLANALMKSAAFLQKASVGHITINQNENIDLLTRVIAFLTPPLLVMSTLQFVFNKAWTEDGLLVQGAALGLSALSATITWLWFRKDHS